MCICNVYIYVYRKCKQCVYGCTVYVCECVQYIPMSCGMYIYVDTLRNTWTHQFVMDYKPPKYTMYTHMHT